MVCSVVVLLSGCRARSSAVEPLTPEQEATIRSTFREVGAGHEPGARPGVPASGWRWSDVEEAARLAAVAVEAAVVRSQTFMDEAGRPAWRFEVMTIEDWPGELIITQFDANDPNGVRAMATIGLYRDRAERAKRLVAAFHERLRALGKVARFEN